MEYRIRSSFAALTILVLATSVSADGGDQWTRFRGPNGSGIANGAGLPDSFDKESALWSTEVPFGRSSPAVGTNLIFLTAVEGEELATLALARETGTLRWKRSVTRARQAELHQATDSSTPTAATDGEAVFVFFQEFGLLAYGPTGQETWRHPLPEFRNYYGMSASPIVVGDLVIQLCDQAGGSFLLALDRETGETAWRQERTKRRESYSTPVLYPDAADPQLVLVYGSKYLDAYDPATGQPVWTLPGLGAGPVASPVVEGRHIYLSTANHNENPLPAFASLLEKHDADGSGELARQELEGTWIDGNFLWIDFDGNGSLSAQDWEELNDELDAKHWGLVGLEVEAVDQAPKLLWNYQKNASYIPTPVVHGGLVYMVEDSIVSAVDAASGELVKRGRIEQGKTYASPIVAGNEILFAQLDGKVSVVRAGAQWEVVRTHDFGESLDSTPALVDGVLYLRTGGRLLAFPSVTEVLTE